jgi:hypothetical protein
VIPNQNGFAAWPRKRSHPVVTSGDPKSITHPLAGLRNDAVPKTPRKVENAVGIGDQFAVSPRGAIVQIGHGGPTQEGVQSEEPGRHSSARLQKLSRVELHGKSSPAFQGERTTCLQRSGDGTEQKKTRMAVL